MPHDRFHQQETEVFSPLSTTMLQTSDHRRRSARHIQLTGPTSKPTAPMGHKLRAHVVEDCVSTRLLHCHFLQSLGFDTTSSSTVEAAIEHCKTQTFDLMLMDISLPGMSGLEAVTHLQGNDKVHPPRKVVLCSGYRADTFTLPDTGCSFLAKPVTRQEIGKHLGQLKLEAVA